MITLIKDDYSTPIVFHAKTDGKTIPLIGTDVVFEFFSKSSNRRAGGGKCEIVDIALGMAKYTFNQGELVEVGEYQGRVKIDMSQGAIRNALAFDFQVAEIPA